MTSKDPFQRHLLRIQADGRRERGSSSLAEQSASFPVQEQAVSEREMTAFQGKQTESLAFPIRLRGQSWTDGLGWEMGRKAHACPEADGGKPGCQAQQRRWDWRNLSEESELQMLSDVGNLPPWLPLSTSCTASPTAGRPGVWPGQCVAPPPKLGPGQSSCSQTAWGTAAHTGLPPRTLGSTGFILWLFSESPSFSSGLETTAVAGLVALE